MIAIIFLERSVTRYSDQAVNRSSGSELWTVPELHRRPLECESSVLLTELTALPFQNGAVRLTDSAACILHWVLHYRLAERTRANKNCYRIRCQGNG